MKIPFFKRTELPGKGICYSATLLTEEQHAVVRFAMTSNLVTSDEYILRSAARAFFQGGYDPNPEGWALLEFWTDNMAAIEEFIAYIHYLMGVDAAQRQYRETYHIGANDIETPQVLTPGTKLDEL